MLLLVMVVMVVLFGLMRSLLISIQLVSLFNSCEEAASRLVASEMRTDLVESARTLVSKFVESNEIVWLNNKCVITGGSTRVRVMQVNGLTAVVRDCISDAVYTVNAVDMIKALVK